MKTDVLTQFPSLMACFTDRHGGLSRAPYATLNLAFHVGDLREDVLANHDRLADTLGYVRARLVHMVQVHSDTIHIVEEGDDFEHPITCDALISTHVDTPLMVMSADCTPILLYDPIHRVIAAVHAGRAGALSRILPKTLEQLQSRFGTRYDALHVAIGPAIGGCCYGVNETIAQQAHHYPQALRWDQQWFLDVGAIIDAQLQEYGVIHIDRTQAHCSACQSDQYFSYRAHHQHTGRMAGVIMLRS